MKVQAIISEFTAKVSGNRRFKVTFPPKLNRAFDKAFDSIGECHDWIKTVGETMNSVRDMETIIQKDCYGYAGLPKYTSTI